MVRFEHGDASGFRLGGVVPAGGSGGSVRAKPEFKAKAEQGAPCARSVYDAGQRCEASGDYADAMKLYEQAAGLGYGPAHAALALLCIHGKPHCGVKRDHRRAFIAATAGAQLQCAHSKGALAWCLVEGIGTEKNVAYALKLAEEGSKLNSPVAQNVMAYMLQNGIGVVRDLTKAFNIYAVAAKTFPQSQCNLAWMYLCGEGCDLSMANAAKWLQKASASGHALSQFNLAMMMRSGQGVRKNEDAALGLIKAAASQELPQAMLELATMHMEGKGGMRTKNIYQARLLLQRAAELEDPHAHFKLGEMHENGIGIEKNLRLAAHHFQQASQIGHDEATVKLGLITRAAAV